MSSPVQLNFLREQHTEEDKFKFELWNRLNDLVLERLKAECNEKHETEENQGRIVFKKKLPPVPHNSVKSFADAMNSQLLLSQSVKRNNQQKNQPLLIQSEKVDVNKKASSKSIDNNCKLRRGDSERNLELFAAEMDQIDIPEEQQAECTCSSNQNMESKL